MSSQKEAVVKEFSLGDEKQERLATPEEGAAGHEARNEPSGMGLVDIGGQERPESPVAGPSSSNGPVVREKDPVLLSLGAIKQKQPEESVGSCEGAAGGQRGAPHKRQRIGNSNFFNDPILGLCKEGCFNLDLSMSLEDAKSLNFQFDQLASVLNSTPGFDDDSLFDMMRKDPLAAFNLPSVTVEKVLQLMETDVACGRVEFIKSNWRRFCIGTFRVGKSSFPTDLIVSRYGLCFPARHTNLISGHQVKICIPITDIMDLKIYNGTQICVIGIRTGSAYAAWLRTALGMENNLQYVDFQKSKCLPRNFYGPLLGGAEHEWIILVVEKLAGVGYSKLKTFFLHPNGKDFVCNFLEMTHAEAQEFVKIS